MRTSSGTFLSRGRDKIVRDIEKRIADFSFIPVGMLFELHLLGGYTEWMKKRISFQHRRDFVLPFAIFF